MKPGDMVQIRQKILSGGKKAIDFYGKDYLSTMVGVRGIIIKDHSPMRPPEVNRIVDVMWYTGCIEEEIFSDELEMINETRTR